MLIWRKRFLAIAVLLLVGWIAAWGAARLLIVRVPLQKADAIIVLSGSRRIAERVHFAAELYKQGRAPRVILTNDNEQGGWDNKRQRNPFSYEWSVQILQSDGVPADRIEVLPQPVSGTYEELTLVREEVSHQELRSLLVVTSAYHTRRVRWTVHHVFKNPGLVVGIEPSTPTFSPWSWWLHRSGWPMVAGEYVKMVYYWFKFR
jgi:uncharacterized SAM-binding protein YcdF (DUF218 family)